MKTLQKAKFNKTGWQLEFFVALMSSWSAFQLFILKQYNKKMLFQYLNRFFPCVKEKVNGSKKNNNEISEAFRSFVANNSSRIIEIKPITYDKNHFIEKLDNFLNSYSFNSKIFSSNNVFRINILRNEINDVYELLLDYE